MLAVLQVDDAHGVQREQGLEAFERDRARLACPWRAAATPADADGQPAAHRGEPLVPARRRVGIRAQVGRAGEVARHAAREAGQAGQRAAQRVVGFGVQQRRQAPAWLCENLDAREGPREQRRQARLAPQLHGRDARDVGHDGGEHDLVADALLAVEVEGAPREVASIPLRQWQGPGRARGQGFRRPVPPFVFCPGRIVAARQPRGAELRGGIGLQRLHLEQRAVLRLCFFQATQRAQRVAQVLPGKGGGGVQRQSATIGLDGRLVLLHVLQHHAQVFPGLAVGGVRGQRLPVCRGRAIQLAGRLAGQAQVELEGGLGRTLLHCRAQQQQCAGDVTA